MAVLELGEVGLFGVALAGGQEGDVGRRLVAACVAEAGRASARRLMLEVAADNAPAFGFYRALGFEETGRRPGYYSAKPRTEPCDALVLSKAVEPAKIR